MNIILTLYGIFVMIIIWSKFQSWEHKTTCQILKTEQQWYRKHHFPYYQKHFDQELDDELKRCHVKM